MVIEMFDKQQPNRWLVAALILFVALGLLSFAAWRGSWELIGSDKFVRKGLTLIVIGLFCSSYTWLQLGVFVNMDPFPENLGEAPSRGRKMMYHGTAISHPLLYLGGVIFMVRGVLGF